MKDVGAAELSCALRLSARRRVRSRRLPEAVVVALLPLAPVEFAGVAAGVAVV